MWIVAGSVFGVVRRFLKECEWIAEAYAEEKIIHKGKIVDVLIPYWGNTRALMENLHVIKRQTYPHIEIFILNFTNQVVNELNEFAEMTMSVLDCKEEPRDSLIMRLSAQTQGDYVQWLLPETNLEATHIQKMVAVFETQDYRFPLILANQMQPFDALRPYLDICGGLDCRVYDREQLWQNMLAMGKYPANGMDDVLIPKRLMCARGWLLDCIDESGARIFSMWRSILQRRPEDGTSLGLYAFQDDSAYIRIISMEAYIRHQMEWMELLSEEGSILSTEGLEQAISELIANYRYLLTVCDSKETQLFRSYQELMQVFGGECDGK